MLDQQNHVAGGANGSIMVGMFVCLCLASKKPSEQEFFVPAGTDLGVKLLNNFFPRPVSQIKQNPKRFPGVRVTDLPQPCRCSSEWHHHGDGICWMVDEAANHPTLLFLRE